MSSRGGPTHALTGGPHARPHEEDACTCSRGGRSARRNHLVVHGSGKLIAKLERMALYLVTGGAGFIGSHLSEELVRRGHRVRVADSLITGKRSNLDHVPGVEFLEGDLADVPFAQPAVDGPDYVLHRAPIPSVPPSVHHPTSSNRANLYPPATRHSPPHSSTI